MEKRQVENTKQKDYRIKKCNNNFSNKKKCSQQNLMMIKLNDSTLFEITTKPLP